MLFIHRSININTHSRKAPVCIDLLNPNRSVPIWSEYAILEHSQTHKIDMDMETLQRLSLNGMTFWKMAQQSEKGKTREENKEQICKTFTQYTWNFNFRFLKTIALSRNTYKSDTTIVSSIDIQKQIIKCIFYRVKFECRNLKMKWNKPTTAACRKILLFEMASAAISMWICNILENTQPN